MPLNTTMTLPSSTSRSARRAISSSWLPGGVCSSTGVKLKRVLTQCLQRRLDPFLMFDAFGRDAQNVCREEVADHPHCGHEIVTYMIAGVCAFVITRAARALWSRAGAVADRRMRRHSHRNPQQEDGAMEDSSSGSTCPAPTRRPASKSCDFAAEDLVRFTTSAGVRVTVIAGAKVTASKGRSHAKPPRRSFWLQPPLDRDLSKKRRRTTTPSSLPIAAA